MVKSDVREKLLTKAVYGRWNILISLTSLTCRSHTDIIILENIITIIGSFLVLGDGAIEGAGDKRVLRIISSAGVPPLPREPRCGFQ
jgi:hypothetical protein